MSEKEINQFDLVALKTTKNVKLLTTNNKEIPSPHGSWSVIGFMKNDILVCKSSTVCALPIEDITLVAKYNLNKTENKDGQKQE